VGDGEGLRETDAEDETQEELLLCLELKVPYHGDRKQEYPDVGDQIAHIGEVDEVDHGQAFPHDVSIPVGVEWPASKEQGDRDANPPCYHECCGRKDDCAEDRMNKDAPVEGEDAELDGHKGDVVEMAEYVIAFPNHHLIMGGDNYDMLPHAVRWAWSRLAMSRYR
jgi:hypothetical protein